MLLVSTDIDKLQIYWVMTIMKHIVRWPLAICYKMTICFPCAISTVTYLLTYDDTRCVWTVREKTTLVQVRTDAAGRQR